MGVDIEQHLRSAVAHPVLDVFDADAVLGQTAGMVMPEFVKGDVDAGRLGQAFKFFRPVARVLQFTVGIGKDKLVLFP